jgi:hypothetical protein
MVQVVNRPSLTAESDCGGQSGIETGFPHITSAFPCQMLFFIYLLLLPEGQTAETLEYPKMQCPFINLIALVRKVLHFHSVLKDALNFLGHVRSNMLWQVELLLLWTSVCNSKRKSSCCICI